MYKRHFLYFSYMNHRIKIWRAGAYLKIFTDKIHPLHQEIFREKGDRLEMGKS
jgi:hypothetical protein